MPKQNREVISFSQKYTEVYEYLNDPANEISNKSDFICAAIREKIEKHSNSKKQNEVMESLDELRARIRQIEEQMRNRSYSSPELKRMPDENISEEITEEELASIVNAYDF